jgi:hypothetical protein
MELQQRHKNPDDNSNERTNTGINSPVNSPIEKFNLTSINTDDKVLLFDQIIPNALDKPKSSAQQEPSASRFESVFLPPIYRQRESAVRSTLNQSLPVFGSLFRQEDEELRRESAIQKDRRTQLEHAKQVLKHLYEERTGNKSYQQSNSYQFHQKTQTQAQTHAHTEHAHAQAYYLAQAHVQTYGHPQQQMHRNFQRPQQPQQHHKQPIMGQNVCSVQNRLIPLPWPDANSNRNNSTLNSSKLTAMQNSFSVNDDGVRIQRTILSNEPSSASVFHASLPHQRQIDTSISYGHLPNAYMVGHIPPQQVNQQRIAQQHAAQQQSSHLHFREAQMQVTQRVIDQQGMSHGRLPLNPFIICPLDPLQIHQNNYITQQIYNQREPLQQQAYRQHQQMHEKAIKHENQKIPYKQQQQEKELQHKQHFQQQRMSPQSPNYEIAKVAFQQVMNQRKVFSRQRREASANNDSLAHILSHQPHLEQQQQHQKEDSAATIIPTAISDILMTTEVEDEGMYEGEEGDYDGDKDEEEEEYIEHETISGSASDSQGSSNIDKNAKKTNKKGKGATKEKPRWSPQLRETLLKAVIAYKNLDDMTSFHWCQIGKQVGRSGKACKDQWRRALLPKIQQTFDHYDQDYNSAFSASLQQQYHYHHQQKQQQQQQCNNNQCNKN